jgi:hypothetical protein
MFSYAVNLKNNKSEENNYCLYLLMRLRINKNASHGFWVSRGLQDDKIPPNKTKWLGWLDIDGLILRVTQQW